MAMQKGYLGNAVAFFNAPDGNEPLALDGLVVNHGSSHLGALRYLIVSRLSKASTIGVYLVPRVVDDVTVKEIEPIVKDFRSSDSVQDAGCPGHQQ
ncbi:hypothetical protein U9M48_025410 [Paspalum notatum var. saurae]|uniref:Uncharacterized protein n=1 Tax=Paspalum notatum var. saurae TaxID=547442 RepID=A0AAQ3TQB7_PASNO